jgi:tRNA pseudouridine65 synthase
MTAIEAEEGRALQILFRDQWVVVVNKPEGMLVHRSWLDKDETRFLLQTLRDQIGQKVYPVHRLDRPTSGVILFALSSEIARQISETLPVWKKYYLALVRGYVLEPGTLDYPLKEQLDAIADACCRTDKAPQSAVTRYHPIAYTERPYPAGRYATARFTLLACQPLTGRKHQIRRHLSHLRHPVIGDTTHGDGKQNQAFRLNEAIHRLMLHACQLEWVHPVSGERVVVRAPSECFDALYAQMGWKIDEEQIQSVLVSMGSVADV